jgi:hypothetical protein
MVCYVSFEDVLHDCPLLDSFPYYLMLRSYSLLHRFTVRAGCLAWWKEEEDCESLPPGIQGR